MPAGQKSKREGGERVLHLFVAKTIDSRDMKTWYFAFGCVGMYVCVCVRVRVRIGR